MDPNTRALIMGAAGAGGEKIYVEDVFSTFLYTGNDSTRTITNGIDLSGKGGLVWIKCRTTANSNNLYNTTRGATKYLSSNGVSAESTLSQGLTAFGSTGFTLGSDNFVNASSGAGGGNYASWTFREAAKFFDVVTYTGNGSTNRQIAHSLGSVPGCIIVKSTSNTTNWTVYHRSTGNTQYLDLNATSAAQANNDRWNDTTPTSTVFTVGDGTGVNANGYTYVAYLFAHDAGGFGVSGNDNAISCGGFTTSSGGAATVNLGYQPQWILTKAVSTTGDWMILDTMREYGPAQQLSLFPNTAGIETGPNNYGNLETNGFTVDNFGNTVTYIYVAIRRPNKVPTTGESVFEASTSTGVGILASNTGVSQDYTTINDAVILRPYRTATTAPSWVWADALRGYGSANSPYLNSTSSATETTTTLVKKGTDNYLSFTGASFPTISYGLRRAPGFFDVVAYTGVSPGQSNDHNLGVTPDLIIGKSRTSGGYNDWYVWSPTGAGIPANTFLILSSTAGRGTFGSPSNWTATSTTFKSEDSFSGVTYIAYLFASCPGVSKVGNYTGTGTTLNVDCGFTNGARFVMIKRTDSTGDWYVWDTVRGIISSDDPYLLFNSTAAEVTNTDFIDPLSSGFQISSTAPAAINASGGNFIYIAIA